MLQSRWFDGSSICTSTDNYFRTYDETAVGTEHLSGHAQIDAETFDAVLSVIDALKIS